MDIIGTYNYRELGPSEIRLLILEPEGSERFWYSDAKTYKPIQCRLQTVNVEDKPAYEALSYAWGNRSQQLPLSCEGQSLPVFANLHLALAHLQLPDKERVLWADAVCIDQSDGEEKSRQVRMMGDVYAAAERVLVWLGEETIEVKDVLLDIQKALDFFPVTQVPLRSPAFKEIIDGTEPFLRKSMDEISRNLRNWMHFDWQPIADLLSRSWFFRKWIIQEIVRAKEAHIILGYRSLPWDKLEALAVYLQVSSLIQFAQELNTNEKASEAISHIDTLANLREDPLNYELSHLLLLARTFECEDPRDNIFGLIGLAKDIEEGSSILRPDYQISEAELFRRYVEWSIQERASLDFLSLSSGDPPGPNLSYASWIPDLARLDITASGHDLTGHYTASGNAKVEAQFLDSYKVLRLRGREVAGITELSDVFETPSADSRSAGSDEADADIESLQMASARRRITWLQNCRNIAASPGTEMSMERHEELWRTLVWDTGPDMQRANQDLSALFNQYFTNMEDLFEPHEAEWYRDVATLSRLIDPLIGRFSVGRRIGRTGIGSLCSIPATSKVGDKICCLFGGKVLHVLRPVENGRQWTVLGDCYLHGFMDGKAMELDTTAVNFDLI